MGYDSEDSFDVSYALPHPFRSGSFDRLMQSALAIVQYKADMAAEEGEIPVAICYNSVGPATFTDSRCGPD